MTHLPFILSYDKKNRCIASEFNRPDSGESIHRCLQELRDSIHKMKGGLFGLTGDRSGCYGFRSKCFIYYLTSMGRWVW